jgi:hypothetical protein
MNMLPFISVWEFEMYAPLGFVIYAQTPLCDSDYRIL